MKRNVFFLALAGMCCVFTANAQTSFWNSPDAYLGQTPPNDTPKIFAKRLLAQKDTFALDRVAWSDDGKEFYYPTNNTWFSGVNSKLRYFKFDGGKWTGPFVLNAHYYAPTFSVDDNTMYLLGGKGDGKHAFVWASQRTPGGWTDPTVYLEKDYGLYDFMPTISGMCYVGSNAHQGDRKDYTTYDICQLKMTPADTTITSLAGPINTPRFHCDFYVARDESYIIVSTNETKTYECELYISFHKPDDSWSTPVSLGPLINNGVAHRWGQYVSPDGKYLFYSTGHSPADCNIYWVRFDTLLEKLKRSM
ncbi:MAG TPA: hypothetical protein VNX40_08480 [Mucilaginibacter sp.]|jgi:hypothetical protein|nr:hypothetical protein [Mucilaginibacter sp.]